MVVGKGLTPAAAAALSLMNRTVHVKMYPTARSFDERREVLRVLERFGEVTMFRSLKYEPRQSVADAFLSIFRTEESARKIIGNSPLRYRLIIEPPPPSMVEEITSDDSHLDTASLEEAREVARKEREQAQEERVFELHISTSNFDHNLYLSSPSTNPLHGPYKPVAPTRSSFAASLDLTVPRSLWGPGLKDWETDGLKRRSAHDVVDENGGRAEVEQKKLYYMRRRRIVKPSKVIFGLKSLREEYERSQTLAMERKDSEE